MTKLELAHQIVESLRNKSSDETEIQIILSYLDILQPLNMEQFAKWGFPEQQTTIEKCWIS